MTIEQLDPSRPSFNFPGNCTARFRLVKSLNSTGEIDFRGFDRLGFGPEAAAQADHLARRAKT